MYTRFVDDMNLSAKRIPTHTIYDPVTKSLIQRSNSDDIQSVQPDKHTVDILRSIADDIHPMLQWTCDVPSNYEDKCLPVLDLQVFINPQMGDTNNKVTPHGTLKTNILRSLKRQDLGDDMKLLVREVPGQQVRHLVSNVKSFNMKNNCGRPRCFPCSSSK